MNKSQLFAVLMLATLGLIIAAIVMFDSNASIEMQQCGGCHNPSYTQRMAGTGVWPAVFNAIVPEHRGERAKPCSEGYVRGCTNSGCHDGLAHKCPTRGSKQLHKDTTASECTRCHVMGTEPMYTQCSMCHGDYKHANPVEGNCMDCHPGHTTDTSAGCSDCHAKEYAELKEFGGKHATKDTSYDALRHRLSPTTYGYEPPLIGEGCYSCHKEHGESLNCLDCHTMEHGYELADCMTCHNPHAPKTIKLGAIVTSEQCMLCHKEVKQEFITHPTMHARLNCTDCHIEHVRTKACTDCHVEAHKDIVVNVDCMTCHKSGHAPK